MTTTTARRALLRALDGPAEDGPTDDDTTATADRTGQPLGVLRFCAPLVNAYCPGHTTPPYCDPDPSPVFTVAPPVMPDWANADGATATCRIMETRTCPEPYNGPCGDRPCARFESDDPTPWIPDGTPPAVIDALRRQAEQDSSNTYGDAPPDCPDCDHPQHAPGACTERNGDSEHCLCQAPR